MVLDATAAGYGWFVDPTPADDTEFGSVLASQELRAGPGSPAVGRMDLLTVVAHELGHVLGLEDLDPQAVPHDLLTETLSPGVRRLPTPSARAVAPAALETPEAPPAPLAPQAPADPLVLTPTAPAAVVGRAPGGLLLADRAPLLPAASAFALPPPDSQAVADESALALLTVLLAPEADWPRAVAAVRTGGDYPEGRDAFFARLGDPEGFLNLLGGDPSEPWE